jgi:HTH-like domain
MIDLGSLHISLHRPCELLWLNRAMFSYRLATASECTLRLMRLIDEPDTKTPFFGWPQITSHRRRLGRQVNHKRVQRLRQKMGLQAVDPKRHTSPAGNDHKVYPYGLGAVTITRPYQLWRAALLCPDGQGVDVSGGQYRPVQPVSVGLAAVQFAGASFAPGGPGSSAGARMSRDFQHRPGRPIHQPGRYQPLGAGGDCVQHGWPGPCA